MNEERLLRQIKADQLAARKARETLKATLLTTLIGEAEMVGKNDGNRRPTDLEVLNVIKKFLKNIQETAKVAMTTDVLEQERDILEAYLPRQYTEDEIFKLLQGKEKNKGALMKFLKGSIDGYYDGQTASKAVDRYINGYELKLGDIDAD